MAQVVRGFKPGAHSLFQPTNCGFSARKYTPNRAFSHSRVPRGVTSVRAAAAPVDTKSPFASVNSEAALYAILKAGQASGKVTLTVCYLCSVAVCNVRAVGIAALFAPLTSTPLLPIADPRPADCGSG